MTDLELGDFRMAFATALADWFREHAIVCEHTQVIHFGDAAGAVLNTPEFDHLRKLTATCTCGTAGLDYEGPQPDCAVCGAVSAFHKAQDEIMKLRVELDSAWAGEKAAREERDELLKDLRNAAARNHALWDRAERLRSQLADAGLEAA